MRSTFPRCGMDKETPERTFKPSFTTPAKGTTFRIYLSRIEGEAAEAPGERAAAATPCAAPDRR